MSRESKLVTILVPSHNTDIPYIMVDFLLESLEKLRDYEVGFQAMIQVAEPSKEDCQRFWDLMHQIDNDFNFIEDYTEFKKMVRSCHNFRQFCLKQNNCFKTGLLRLLGFNYLQIK